MTSKNKGAKIKNVADEKEARKHTKKENKKIKIFLKKDVDKKRKVC